MQGLLQMPALQAVAILSLIHGAACFTIAGAPGLKETAIFAASGVGTVLVSRGSSLQAMLTWFKSYKSQFHIWLACASIMGLFLIYRSMPRLDVALLEALSAAAFFMFMVSVGNRFLK